MTTKFAEQILDSMVDENGHCGERGLSHKQFGILSQYLMPEEAEIVGCWSGHYKTVDFTSQNYVGTIGKYAVVLNEFWHFNPRHTVVSIDLRPTEEVEREEWLSNLAKFDHSEWMHEPKERVDLDLILVRDYTYERPAYCAWDGTETVHVYTLTDEDGNCYVWKTTSALALDQQDEHGAWEYRYVEPGGRVTMRATVKEHNEYRGVKQTVITRPKVKQVW